MQPFFLFTGKLRINCQTLCFFWQLRIARWFLLFDNKYRNTLVMNILYVPWNNVYTSLDHQVCVNFPDGSNSRQKIFCQGKSRRPYFHLFVSSGIWIGGKSPGGKKPGRILLGEKMNQWDFHSQKNELVEICLAGIWIGRNSPWEKMNWRELELARKLSTTVQQPF